MQLEGILTLTNSTVSGNSAYSTGGVFNSGTATLTQSTVSGNYSGFDGGGVSNGGTLTLARTLISGNTVYSGANEVSLSMYGPATIVVNNHNLFGHDGDAGVAGFAPGPTDIVPNAPLGAIRKTLADNGGPTKTHALPAGSPAIGQSPANSGCKPTDQRGVTRPQGEACDIGAFEKGPPVRCGGRIARILGTVGDDRLTGTPGPDVIHGLAGRDTIEGLEGNDIICGGTGDDKLFGASGADKLNGGSGTDTCNGGSGADTGVSETEISIP
ncbi:MAG: choice-of-anchor Q domain-containing protein [Gammaproteobacteria bacterium]